MQNKRILVTGGAGSIGSELVRQLIEGNSVYILDNNETAFFDLFEELKQEGMDVKGRVGDVRDYMVLEEVFEEFKPQIVFHAAALKHVTPCEWNPEEAVRTNILGTINIVKASKKYGIEKLVNISTDKVVNAHSVMGVTKRLGELIVKNAGYVSVRFGNVLGSRGSVIPIWQKQINEGRPLTVTHKDMKRYFMTIPEAVHLVIQASEKGEAGSIMILDMGEEVNVLELAKEILKKSDKDLPITFIGIRPGETMGEVLMTPEEFKKAIKKESFYVIS